MADHILIADQHSSDGSREICARFPSTHVIENASGSYNEAERQILLIETARKLMPGPRILFAVDADEVLAADAPSTPDWEKLLHSPPGTIGMFEKPDLIADARRCVRMRDHPFPLAYVDDGAPHRPRVIHSTRIPTPEGRPRVHFSQIKILHYNLVRPEALRAKRRMYCILENIRRTKSLYRRWLAYHRRIDWTSQGTVEDTPEVWFQGWEQDGIDMRTIERPPHYWQDFEALRLLRQHGSRRFWWDDIWDAEWSRIASAARRFGDDPGEGWLPEPPPRWVNGLRASAIGVTERLFRLRHALRRRV